MERPNDIKMTMDIHIFKEGIKPMWEDTSNRNGGKCMVRVKKGLTSMYWEDLLFAMIGEQFDVGHEICGAVVSIRTGEDIISVWNKSSENVEATNKIRDQIRRILKLPSFVTIEYKKHQECLTDQSSYRNPSLVWRANNGANAPAGNTTSPRAGGVFANARENGTGGGYSPRFHANNNGNNNNQHATTPSGATATGGEEKRWNRWEKEGERVSTKWNDATKPSPNEESGSSKWSRKGFNSNTPSNSNTNSSHSISSGNEESPTNSWREKSGGGSWRTKDGNGNTISSSSTTSASSHVSNSNSNNSSVHSNASASAQSSSESGANEAPIERRKVTHLFQQQFAANK